MATRDLTQTWIYAGKFYGPGPAVELPDDAAEAIDGKMGRTPDSGVRGLASHGSREASGGVPASILAQRIPDEGAHETAEPRASLQGADVPDGDLATDLAQPGRIVQGTVEHRPDDAEEGEQIGPADLPPVARSKPVQRGRR